MDLKILRRCLLLVCIAMVCVGFFYKNDYKSISPIDPRAIAAPVQTPVADPTPITFDKDNYHYTLTPLYDYTLDGLVVHTQQYNVWYFKGDFYSTWNNTFANDLCMLWGSNLQNKSYQNPSLSIGQDYRDCWYQYYDAHNFSFNPEEFSNNHLMASTPQVEQQILSVQAGDQVILKGELVNVNAVAGNNVPAGQPQNLVINTSTTRTDTGNGACEVIYVKSIEIIKSGDQIFRIMYSVGWFGIFALAAWFAGEILVGAFITKSV